MRNRRRSNGRKQIRYAVIGLGHIAQAAVLPAFKHTRKSVLTALVSSDATKLKELGPRYGVNALYDYDNVDELLTSGAIDAVYIALPNDMHKEYTVRAARAGLHVLCEKPMAITTRECAAMIRACERSKVKLMIAYRLHFEKANLRATQLAHGGTLGELRYFSSDFSMQVSDENIRLLPTSEGGGPLYDIGIYCINAARYSFAEDPIEVWASAARSGDPRFNNIDETVCGVMRFKSKRMATFTCSFGAADRSTYTIAGTRGTVTVDPAYEYAEGLGYEVKVDGKIERKQLVKSDQFAPELEYFSNCVLNDRQPGPSGKEGLFDVRIIEGMLRSIATGRWVALNTAQRKRRPTMRQEIRRPAVRREPSLVHAAPASQ